MHHEHVRSDRDNYVTVHQSNVNPDVYTVSEKNNLRNLKQFLRRIFKFYRQKVGQTPDIHLN